MTKIALVFLLASLTGASAGEPPPPPPANYAVALPFAAWAQVAGAIRRGDRLTARDADDLVTQIANQVAAQQNAKAPKEPKK